MKLTLTNKLGSFIKEVDLRNSDLSVDLLLGVSNEKYFIPSIANIVGTDLSKYKIVKYNQFAFGPVTSRNGDKLSIALLKEKECIVSSSYVVFEITDTEKLDPDFLLLWFKRSEFDRLVRFKSHGSVREIFSWEKLCDLDVPCPSIEEQRKIVNEFKIIENRIRLKEEINSNLINICLQEFKRMFGDLFNDIDKKNVMQIKDLGQIICGKTPSTMNRCNFGGQIPFITIPDMHSNTFILKTERTLTNLGANSQKTKFVPKGTVCVSCIASSGIVSITSEKSQTNQQINSIIPSNLYGTSFIYFLMLSMAEIIRRKGEGGTTTLNLNKNSFSEIKFIKPESNNVENFNRFSNIILLKIYENQKEILMLKDISSLILSKALNH